MIEQGTFRHWFAVPLCTPFFAMGCEGADPSPPKDGVSQYAAIVDRKTFIVAARPVTEVADAVLAGEPTGSWWVRIDVPSEALETGEPTDGISATFDLTDSSAQLAFSQSYYDSCDPSNAARTENCWLVEEYQSGENGLRGVVSLAYSGEDLVGGFDIYWEGVTERFDGPAQWHGHGSSSGLRISKENVVEVSK